MYMCMFVLVVVGHVLGHPNLLSAQTSGDCSTVQRDSHVIWFVCQRDRVITRDQEQALQHQCVALQVQAEQFGGVGLTCQNTAHTGSLCLPVLTLAA